MPKQIVRVGLSGGAPWHGVAGLVLDHHSTHMAKEWSWRVVACVSTPHKHSHQVKSLVLIVSHCLDLLLIDRVVDVLSQFI